MIQYVISGILFGFGLIFLIPKEYHFKTGIVLIAGGIIFDIVLYFKYNKH